jgi:hypothetical protein
MSSPVYAPAVLPEEKQTSVDHSGHSVGDKESLRSVRGSIPTVGEQLLTVEHGIVVVRILYRYLPRESDIAMGISWFSPVKYQNVAFGTTLK